MDIPSEFRETSDEELLRLWINKSEFNAEAVQKLQFELEKRRLAKVVYTTAGLPRMELLRTPSLPHRAKAPRQWSIPQGAIRLLFMASGGFLAIVLRFLVPSIKNTNNLEPLIAVLAGVVLIPLIVFLILNKVWKPHALLVTAIVSFTMTVFLVWYGGIIFPGGRQVRREIVRSSSGLIALHQKLQQDLDHCRVPDILELLVVPDRLTKENLADAESRMSKAGSLLEDYSKQLEEWNDWVQKNLQPTAEASKGKDWNLLKEALSMESQWLQADKEFFAHVAEFVRYMRYYRHLYRVENHKIVFNEAEGIQNYEYYKNEVQAFAERQKKLDAALAAQWQQLVPRNPAKPVGL